MEITKNYEFSPFEQTILKMRIQNKITEAEASKQLKVPRQRVNDMIAKFVMMENKSGSYSPC